MNAQMRRPSQAEQLRAQLGVASEDQLPMTAALGGKFGSRVQFPGLPEEDLNTGGRMAFQNPPVTPNHTTVISGGTSLGTSSNNGNASSNSITPSKSDAAVSWRRGGQNSVLSGSRSTSLTAPPNVKITPPPVERISPPPGISVSSSPVRTRPQPLRFSAVVSRPLSAVAIDEGTDGEDNSSVASFKSGGSPPTTPQSSASSPEALLSPREEAAKKLYEGLGLGRLVPAPPATAGLPQRVLSLAVRQPRGPPSGADELGSRNFATRIRRKAIGGLGALMGARERRDVIEAF